MNTWTAQLGAVPGLAGVQYPARKTTLIHILHKSNAAKFKMLAILQYSANALILKDKIFRATQHESRLTAAAQNEKPVFRRLSTKLSTGSVDKNRKLFVYRDLARF